jgi:hypothetical protein
MYKPPVFTALILLVFPGLPLAAQVHPAGGAAALDAVLDSPAVTWGEAARFVWAAAGRGDLSGEDAFAALQGIAKLPRGARSDAAASLGGLSIILMKAFGIQSGLFRFIPSGRYACRELAYLGVIQGRADPGLRVSGERFLHILGRALDYGTARGEG